MATDNPETCKSKLHQRIKEIEATCPNEIRVSKRLTNPEILVIQAKHYLEAQPARDWRGNPNNIATRTGLLSVRVTKTNISRMMMFIDSFIKLVAKRGHQVQVHGRETVVVVDGEQFHVQFREKCTRQVLEENRWYTTELIPNGRLSMKLDYPLSLKGTEWVDRSRKLEKQLSTIVAALELKAEQEKIDRTEREQRWAEQRRLKELEEQRKEFEEAMKYKAQKLIDDASKWQVAHLLKLFITEVESRHEGEVVSSEVKEWLVWADDVRASTDPLSKDILDYVRGYGLTEI